MKCLFIVCESKFSIGESRTISHANDTQAQQVTPNPRPGRFSTETPVERERRLPIQRAPINGLPQDGGAGQPTGIRLRKAHVGGHFDIDNGPQGGQFDSTAILKSGEDLGMSEWSVILETTQKSFERVSRFQGGLNER